MSDAAKILVKKTDGSVSLVRVTGMICIILCHVSSFVGQQMLAQLFNVGVPLFLLISGYLYADKVVQPLPFLRKRLVKLTLPVLLFVLLLAGYCRIAAVPDVRYATLPLYALNLQGLSFLCSLIPYTELCSGAGHLWFLTALMVCYLCMLVVKRTERANTWTRRTFILFCFVSGALVAVCLPIGFSLQYLQAFFIGYGFHKVNARIRGSVWLWISVLMAFAMAARLLLHRYMDETDVYMAASALSHNILAFWIFACFRFLYAHFDVLIDRLAQTGLFRHVDGLSYYVYIVHYMFLVGPLEVDRFVSGTAQQLLLFFGCTFIAAEALYWLSKPLQKLA